MTKRHPRTVFTGKLLKVTHRFLQKKGNTHLHETVHHPGSCAILPLLNSKTLLLLRQFRPSIGERLWEIPAGTLEPGESPLTCARRELEEETGYRAERVKPLAIFYPSPGFCTEKMYLFLAEGLRPFSQKLDPGEAIRVHPIRFPGAFKLLKEKKIKDAKTIIALHFLRTRRSQKRR